jgi:hypothetical protein
MKKLLLILPLIIACKSTKPSCDAYGAYRIPYTDSIVISEYHVFSTPNEKHHHVYVPKEIIYIKDSIEICIPVRYEYQKVIK